MQPDEMKYLLKEPDDPAFACCKKKLKQIRYGRFLHFAQSHKNIYIDAHAKVSPAQKQN